jgi:hypothetical protein
MSIERKREFLSRLNELLSVYRHYHFDTYELLIYIVKRLCPEMIKKPRIWEKILRKNPFMRE